MPIRANADIRQVAKNSGVRHYEICSALNIRPDEFSVMLRTEMNSDEKQKIYKVIEILAQKGGVMNGKEKENA